MAIVRVYFDLCALKRPFDDQSRSRIRLESEAVLAIIQSGKEELLFAHASAQDFENELNPLFWRADRVRRWLSFIPVSEIPFDELQPRAEQLAELNFKAFDAVQLASAELANADVFCTCDDRLLKNAVRQASQLMIRVVDPVQLAKELIYD